MRAALVAVLFGGCASPRIAAEIGEHAATCDAVMAEAVFRSSTCTEAQLRVDRLAKTDPACSATYPDGGPDVCAILRRLRDGGPDAR